MRWKRKAFIWIAALAVTVAGARVYAQPLGVAPNSAPSAAPSPVPDQGASASKASTISPPVTPGSAGAAHQSTAAAANGASAAASTGGAAPAVSAKQGKLNAIKLPKDPSDPTETSDLILPGNLGQATKSNAPAATTPPANWTASLFHPSKWPFSLFPVPEIATDPNAGTTVGLLPVFLFNDEHQQIRNILAPDIAYNTELGASGNFRFLSYPSSDTQWYVTMGASQNIARRVDIFYSTGRDRKKWWSFEGRFFFERDPTERFYGLGNQSNENDETNYTTEQLYGRAQLGLNISEKLQIGFIVQPWWVRIQQGAIDSLPYIGTLFPTVKGLDGGSQLLGRLVVAYDTRDSVDIPTTGGLYRVFYGASDRAFLSSTSFNQAGFEVRKYIHLNKIMTLASHLYAEWTPAGNETPFWAMPRLGGEESTIFDQQTLRGYGVGRYIDNNLTDLNFELRTRVWETDLMGTHGVVEVAPFMDFGKVYHSFSDNPVNQLHPVGGVGFRGLATPFVVGFVDLGMGAEGPTVFSGINYPF